LESDVLESDVLESDVLESDVLESDVLESDVLEGDVLFIENESFDALRQEGHVYSGRCERRRPML